MQVTAGAEWAGRYFSVTLDENDLKDMTGDVPEDWKERFKAMSTRAEAIVINYVFKADGMGEEQRRARLAALK